MATLSQILNKKIGKDGKSKTSVAVHLGVSERTIENYMNGNRQPKPEALAKLAKFLDFDLNELYEQNVPRGTIAQPVVTYKKSGSTEPDYTNKYIALLEEKSNLTEKIQTLESKVGQLLTKIEQGLENQERMAGSLLSISELFEKFQHKASVSHRKKIKGNAF